jgi:pyruvate/2-oxoglutarate dehydrogenase complex dihydrolipoamide acyltransferase (E2) component
LVLIEGAGQPGSLNHLGMEVESTDEVGAAIMRLQAEGLATDVEEQTTCCYAVQDKVWVHGPDAEPWEVYTVLADAPTMHDVPAAPTAASDAADAATDAACCAPAAVTEPTPVTFSARCC